MFEFKPEKLSVNFKNGTDNMKEIVPRVYTMTHSDETADLFVTVGVIYDCEKINETRDEVLAEWVKDDEGYKANIYVQVDGKSGLKETKIRNEIFRRELPLALTAIRYADKGFFEKNKHLDKVPIVVNFNSSVDEYNKQEDFGTFELYNTHRREENADGEFVKKDNGNMKLESKKRNKHKSKKRERAVNNEAKMQEDVILNLLNPYIQGEIWITYGRVQYFCLSDVEILSIKPVEIQSPCRRKFEVAVGIKVGQEPPPYNNMIIEFWVSSNGVTTKSVKNPR